MAQVDRSVVPAGGRARQEVEGAVDDDAARCSRESARASRDELCFPDAYGREVFEDNLAGGAGKNSIAVRRRPGNRPLALSCRLVNGDVRGVGESAEIRAVAGPGEMVQIARYRLRRV